MRKVNFALISDVLFFALCAFILSFTLIRFYTKSAVTALICAVGVAVACAVIAFFILYSKRKKHLIVSLGESEKKSLSLHLSVCGAREVHNLFLSALDGAYIGDNLVQDEENAYFFNFKLSPVSPDDIAEIIKSDVTKKKCVFCCEASPAALSLAEDFEIRITCVSEIYALLKDKNLLPEKYALGNVKKPNIFKRIKKRFNRRLCPSLFFCGLSLLFFSFFTSHSVTIYYVVSGGLLMVLSAVSLLFGQTS